MPEKLIIVGAPRSGTNMLRDVLSALPGFETWDCDEINLTWKHGNVSVPHDELTRANATPQVRSFLRKVFDGFGRKHDAEVVVEKTCATSLRVGFVDEVLPDAKFIFIRRDGIDATASTMKRWNAPFDLKYTLKKVRYVPLRDFPQHLASFAGKKVKQRLSGDAGQEAGDAQIHTWWGPKPHDYQQIMAQHTLEEAAFIQWQRCVEASAAEFAQIAPERWHEVRYEEFVADPAAGVEQILSWLGRPEAMSTEAVAQVRKASVGKGRSSLGPEKVAKLEAIGAGTLKKFGYA